MLGVRTEREEDRKEGLGEVHGTVKTKGSGSEG